MTKELFAQQNTNTQELVSHPLGKRATESRWVYKIKTKSDESVVRYKTCLVTKGFSQQYGMDYEETLALVAKMTTIHTLIVVSSIHEQHIYQMDIKKAFLNGDLHYKVYMVPLPSVSHNHEEMCKLKKTIYGLKQAIQASFVKFITVITSFGFRFSDNDSALFVKTTTNPFNLL